MSPLLLFFADGTAFFVGIGLLVAGIFCGRETRRGRRLVGLLLFSLSAILIVLSATPLPLWLYGIWALLAVACFLRREVAFFLVIFSLGVGVAEGVRRLPPLLHLVPGETVYVVGDSISAGIGTGETPWPLVFGKKIGHSVVNLAIPGATVDRAFDEIARIPDGDAFVLVEIGGNDLLSGRDDAEFAQGLDELLSRLAIGNRRVAMFELPLPPFRNGFGQVQRELAEKHHVRLLPKTWLAAVLGMEGGTRDGLHLSQKGSEALAAKLAARVREG